MKNYRTILLVSACLFIPATGVQAQDTQETDSLNKADISADASQSNDAIVVTGVARGTNRLDTSISVTSIGEEAILQSAPRSAAEILRNVPGIRAESSGGEGNANINVRGLPVSTGGAKFLQLQEDGLPILEFGDIIFGNADIFLRLDSNLARVESVRGGSASHLRLECAGRYCQLHFQGRQYRRRVLAADIGYRLSQLPVRFRIWREPGQRYAIPCGRILPYRRRPAQRRI